MRLISQGDGMWVSEDGRCSIERDDTYETYCDDPHPQKLSRDDRAKFAGMDDHDRRGLSSWNWPKYWALLHGHKGFVCDGGQSHWYTMWVVVVEDERTEDVYDKFGQARAALEAIAGEKTTLVRRKP